MALPSASTVSTGAGVLAFGVATFVVLVVLAMLAEETLSSQATSKPYQSIQLFLNRLCSGRLL